MQDIDHIECHLILFLISFFTQEVTEIYFIDFALELILNVLSNLVDNLFLIVVHAILVEDGPFQVRRRYLNILLDIFF